MERSLFGASWAKDEKDRLPFPSKYLLNYQNIKDPYNNRKLIKEICKGNRVVYIWTYRSFFTTVKRMPVTVSIYKNNCGLFNIYHKSNWIIRGLHFSTPSKGLLPQFVTGFSDAEGSFWISVLKDKTYKIGWSIKLCFEIGLAKKDLALLEEIQKFFGVGKIFMKSNGSISYRVTSIKELQVIIEHFNKYPLLTEKSKDFELWAQIFYLIQNKEHLTMQGLMKVIAIKASLNKGLNEELKAHFPNVIPVTKAFVNQSSIKDPNWLAGFASGEGNFLISIFKSNTHTGFAVRLRFKLTQHSRDTRLMESLVYYLGCGRYVAGSFGYNYGDYIVSNLTDITTKIIPFFSKYPIKGIKALDFSDFCKVAQKMGNKDHLTEEGLNQIRLIKSGTNTGR